MPEVGLERRWCCRNWKSYNGWLSLGCGIAVRLKLFVVSQRLEFHVGYSRARTCRQVSACLEVMPEEVQQSKASRWRVG